jgi:hypothetical protein
MIDRLLRRLAKEKLTGDDPTYESLNSDCLDKMEYDSNSTTLVLYFTDGSMYQYFGVDVDVAAELVHSGSHGEFFDINIV